MQKNEETCVLTGNFMNLHLKRMLRFKTSISIFPHVSNTLKCPVNHFVNLVNDSIHNHLNYINSDKLLLALPITFICPHRHSQSHFCFGWTALSPPKFYSDVYSCRHMSHSHGGPSFPLKRSGCLCMQQI